MTVTPIEVEFKFAVDDLEPVRLTLASLQATPGRVVQHRDCYFNDPLRNYAEADIALRLRSSGSRYWVTYKGPPWDDQAKIRQEVEMPLADEVAAEQWRAIMIGMGLEPAGEVHKRRELFSLEWQGSPVEVCLDTVEQLGSFVEVERIVENREDVPLVQSQLAQLARELGMVQPILESYLDLLLQKSHHGEDE